MGDETGMAAAFEARATDLDTSVSIGPLGLFILGGSITLDSDGDASRTLPPIYPCRSPMSPVDDISRAIWPLLKQTTSNSRFMPALRSSCLCISRPRAIPSVDPRLTMRTRSSRGVGNLVGLFTSEDPLVTVSAPDVNSLIDDFNPLDEGVRALADGLDALLQRIEELLRQEVLNRNLPMVGDKTRRRRRLRQGRPRTRLADPA